MQVASLITQFAQSLYLFDDGVFKDFLHWESSAMVGWYSLS